MADPSIKFGVDAKEAREDIKSLSDLVDEVAEEAAQPHPLEIDTSKAEGAVTGLRDMVASVIGAETVSKVGEWLSAFEEKGAGARDAIRTIQAQLGLTTEEAEKLGDRADDLFLKGLGENVEESRRALGSAQQVLGDMLDPQGLDEFTLKVAGVAKVFDGDVKETVEKSRTAIAAWGLEGDQAGQLVALGMQKAVTPSNDFLDTLSEYSPLMKEAGFSASEFTGVLIAGAEGGAFSLDKVADSAKEAQIRLKAGDISTSLAEISTPITSAIAGIVKAGEQGKKTTAEVLSETGAAIEKAFDAGKITEQMRSQLQVAVAGTPAEELGTELYGRIYGAPVDQDAINAAASDAGAQMVEAIGAQTIFEEIGKGAELALTKVSEFAGPLIGGLGGLMETVGPLIPALAALWPAIAAGGGIMATVGTAARAMWLAITGPIGLIILGVAAVVAIFVLLYNEVEEVRVFMDALWASIMQIVDAIWTGLKPVLETAWELLKELGAFIWDVLIGYFNVWWGAITSVVDAIGSLIPGLDSAGSSGSFLEKIITAIGDAFAWIKKQIDFARAGLAGISAAFKVVGDVLSDAWEALKSFDLSRVQDLFSQLGNAIAGGFKAGAEAKMKEIRGQIALDILGPLGSDETGGLKDTADDFGHDTGTKFGTAFKTAATRSLIDFSGDLAKLYGEEFARELNAMYQAALAGSTALLDTGKDSALHFVSLIGDRAQQELALIEAKIQIETKRIDKQFELERTAQEAKIKDANGKLLRLTKKEQDAHNLVMEGIAKRHEDALTQIARDGADMRAAIQTDAFGPRRGVQAIRELAPEAAEPLDLLVIDMEKRAASLAIAVGGIASNVAKAVTEEVSSENAKRAQSTIDALRKEDSELVLSAQRKGEMAAEAGKRRIEIAREIQKAEQELADASVDLWGVAAAAVAAAATGMRDSFITSFDEGLKSVADGTATMSSLVDDMLISITAGTIAAIANGEDAVKAAVGLAFDFLQKMVPIWSAQILGIKLVDPSNAIPGVTAAKIAEWGALSALLSATVAGVRGALGFWEGVVAVDPSGKLINMPGDLSKQDSFWAMLAAGESVITRQATGNNKPLLEAMNRWPMVDFADVLTRARREEVAAFIALEAQAWRQEIMQERQAMRLADEAIRRTSDLTATVIKGQKAIVRELESMNNELRKGIPLDVRTTGDGSSDVRQRRANLLH